LLRILEQKVVGGYLKDIRGIGGLEEFYEEAASMHDLVIHSSLPEVIFRFNNFREWIW